MTLVLFAGARLVFVEEPLGRRFRGDDTRFRPLPFWRVGVLCAMCSRLYTRETPRPTTLRANKRAIRAIPLGLKELAPRTRPKQPNQLLRASVTRREGESVRHSVVVATCLALIVAACGSGGTADVEPTSGSKSPTTTTPGESTTTVIQQEATTTTEAATTTTTQVSDVPTTAKATTTTAPPEPALTSDGSSYTIVWESVDAPFWSPAVKSDPDPFYFIHTFPDADGFYFSIEMYTTGYGALWQGQLGDVEIICDEAPPAPNSTGICPHLDPDGPGPIGDLNADFAAIGSITIDQLDETGYDITVNEIIFSDGSTIESFSLTGP